MIHDDEDREWSKLEDIGKAFEFFYQKLFQTEGTVVLMLV
jgi:hypothetical protein